MTKKTRIKQTHKKLITQIYKELICADYDTYWQKNGVTFRLSKYQQIQQIAKCMILIIDVWFYVFALKIFTLLISNVLIKSSVIFTLVSQQDLILALRTNYLAMASILSFISIIIYLAIGIRNKKCYTIDLYIRLLLKYTLMLYIGLLALSFCTDYIFDNFLFVLMLFYIKQLLKVFDCRVCNMTQYATGQMQSLKMKGKAMTCNVHSRHVDE